MLRKPPLPTALPCANDLITLGAITAGGAVNEARTTRLLSGQEWVGSLHRAQSATEQYRPAR